ncbi:sigma-54 interaction domain-containing protein [Erythrobacter sp.]|jgi:two-component system response regulator FlrC|uniref:sigma-54 interaction domain-containing protein n=1 Tax=Erythrobacter sp. TaxID=1042 RepID=UPI002EA624CE|nr:sigma 54-interacting transcriptional regulator [Erythrobacter sp.]
MQALSPQSPEPDLVHRRTLIGGDGARPVSPVPLPPSPSHASGLHTHSRLLDPVLPLLAHGWQRGRIALGDHGRFDDQTRGSDRVAIDLVHSKRAGDAPFALLAGGAGRITLRYDPNAPNDAAPALLASAGYGGWPVARDPETLALLTLSERIAASDIPVLLEGPTGSGKEIVARFVHNRSARARGPFVAVNCAAMPEAMLEALLFGHHKGAFTGAGDAREGLFRAADGGTLLLDEIGELPLALQAKLLRTLQEGEVLPLGATKPVAVDVRIVAATNRTLSEEAAEGRFREDLYYRLNVFPLILPALRQRPGDIAPLAFAMLLRHGAAGGEAADGLAWISPAALAQLENHAWPGNVRELENVIRRAILLAGDASEIGAEHIHFDGPARPVAALPGAAAVSGALSDVAFRSEAQAILTALNRHDGHRGKTAKSLGISERTLRYRLASMRECGIDATGTGA